MKMSSLLDKNRPVEQATIVLFFIRWIVLPLYQQFSLFTLLQVGAMVRIYVSALHFVLMLSVALVPSLAGGTTVRGWGLLSLFLFRHFAQL